MTPANDGFKYPPMYLKRTSKKPAGTKIDIPKLLSLIAAIGGFIVFYFWIAGRTYAAGFFEAMNIPPYMVNFQVWEYIEQSWFRLSFSLIVYLLLGWISFTIISTIHHWNLLISSFLYSRLPQRLKSHKRFDFPLPDLKPEMKAVIFLVDTLVMLIFFSILLTYVFLMGLVNGNSRVFAAQNIEIISSTNLKLNSVGTQIGTDLYSYSELSLLAYNQGKYYVFNEIDRDTCVPQTVYIIDESNIKNINLGQASAHSPTECQAKPYSLWIFEIPINIPENLLKAVSG